MKSKMSLVLVMLLLLVAGKATAATTTPGDGRRVRIGDVTTIEGIRDNMLFGYGLVAGLNRTGDSQMTVFPMQTLANILRKMGVQTPAASIMPRNVAAVFVTASLPPFGRPGARIDVNVASTGDAKSLEGGLLLMTPLYGSDGQVYAVAQGPVVLGGYSSGANANAVQVNHPTAGRIPEGALVERDTAVDLSHLKTLSLMLRQMDFATAENTAAAINATFKRPLARAVDGRRVELALADSGGETVPELLARIEDVKVTVHPQTTVVVNERTGTVVMGRDVNLGACSIMHGNLAVQISTIYQVSQPNALSSGGQTAVVPQTTVQSQESPAHRVELKEGATVEDLVNGLQGIGATARDIIAILEALRAAGSLQAELEVL